MNNPVEPLGHQVLLKMLPIKFKSNGGIILSSVNEAKREHGGRQIGEIIAFGPLAYKTIEGCNSPSDWGVNIGDIIELNGRYDGKHTCANEYDSKHEDLRYVADTDIVGKFSPELVKNLLREDK